MSTISDAVGSEPPSFAGKVALVTGGSHGIGAATARLLAARGAAVAVNYRRSSDAAQDLVRELTAGGARAIAVGADVTDEAKTRRMVNQVEDELGPIDVLILNAAGFSELQIAPTLKLPYDHLEETVLAQMRAFLYPVYAAAPLMAARGGGSIVVVGAVASRRPSPRFMTIAMAKGAVDAGLRTLAAELGPQGIRVNGVAPGLILTRNSEGMPEEAIAAAAQRAAIRRNGRPEDVAKVIAFLASDQADYLTGAYLLLDGGTAML